MSDSFLLEQSRTTGDGLGQRLATTARQVVEDVARRSADSNCRRVTHIHILVPVDDFIYTSPDLHFSARKHHRHDRLDDDAVLCAAAHGTHDRSMMKANLADGL